MLKKLKLLVKSCGKLKKTIVSIKSTSCSKFQYASLDMASSKLSKNLNVDFWNLHFGHTKNKNRRLIKT